MTASETGLDVTAAPDTMVAEVIPTSLTLSTKTGNCAVADNPVVSVQVMLRRKD